MLTRSLIGPACARYLVGFDLRRRPHLEADVLVIGSGVAGLSAALSAAEAGSEVLLLTKASLAESNSTYAQGGIAAVLDDTRRDGEDDLERHVADTLAAGAGLCDEAAVRDLLGAGGAAIDWLLDQGCRFDRQGTLPDLTREGGHSARRILHANGDATGREITRSLLERVLATETITIIEDAFVLDLLSDSGPEIRGVLYHRRGEFYGALAGATILAGGGCGRVWRETTNPAIATGDALAMAYRAGATLADCEFMQFHPTTLYIAGGARLLITEAMRGEGAVLRDHRGEPFMQRHHELGDLAPRDVVSTAIIAEIARSGFPHVWLDATHLGEIFLRERFPTIHRACQKFSIDIAKDWIPVHPSAHYHCGGVLSDSRGRSDLRGLWVAGEAGCTGLHGANRLASNSLLEGLVVGRRAGRDAAGSGGHPGRVRLDAARLQPVTEELDLADLTRSLRSLMWRDVGLERSGEQLARARRSIRFWSEHQVRGFFPDREGWELQNMLLASALIAIGAEARSASLGTHRRSDSSGGPELAHLTLCHPKGTP